MVAELLTRQATHTHPLAEHFPPLLLTHALTGVKVAQEKLAVHSPALPLPREGHASSRGNVSPKSEGGILCSTGLPPPPPPHLCVTDLKFSPTSSQHSVAQVLVTVLVEALII